MRGRFGSTRRDRLVRRRLGVDAQRLGAVERQDLIRAVAFSFVDRLSDHGERPVAWADLIGFTFEDERVPLVGQRPPAQTT